MNENIPNSPAHESRPATPEELSRRKFLRRLSIGVGGATAVALAAPMAGFILAPLSRKEPRAWRTVGRIDDFKIGETTDVRYEDASPLPWAGVTARTAAWLRRVGPNEFTAFSIHCSHLGCPVRWLKDAELFMCPCHGGVFYKNGAVAAGPPEKPLAQYQVRMLNGEVQILTGPLPILAEK
jgi:menaquinol-cytochrome c reductase iron-sulfur subunit